MILSVTGACLVAEWYPLHASSDLEVGRVDFSGLRKNMCELPAN